MSSFVARLRDPARPTLYGTCVISTSPHFVGATISAGCDFVLIDTGTAGLAHTHPHALRMAWLYLNELYPRATTCGLRA
jgi:hypothetical protein